MTTEVADARKTSAAPRPEASSRRVVRGAGKSVSGWRTPGKFVRNSRVAPNAEEETPAAATTKVAATSHRHRGVKGDPFGKSWTMRKNTSERPTKVWNPQAHHGASERWRATASRANASNATESVVMIPVKRNRPAMTQFTRRSQRIAPTAVHATASGA